MKAFLLVSELEDYAIAFANGVAEHMEVVVAVPDRRFAALQRWFSPAVRVHLMDWPRHRSLRNPAFLWHLNRLIRAEKPDVIHMLSNTTLWLNAAMPFWKPTPVITTVHDVVVHPGDRETQVLPRWATDLAVRQSGDIVVHGEGLRDHAAERFGLARARLHVLSHPVIGRYADLARAEGLVRTASAQGLNVLLFGRIFAYKGLEQLVRTEAVLGDRIPGLRITIAGRGDDPWSMRELMGDPARYDVRHRFIEDAEVAQLFLDADVVALPYTEASQSGVLNVAATFGKPIVATDVGELRRTVEGNGMGLVVPPGDPGAFADALETLARRPDLRAELGARALAWAEGANAPGTVGRAAAELYRHVASRRAAPYAERMRGRA